MEVIRLNQQLFNSNKFNKNEIEDNKNGKRPYFYSFKRNNHRICVPLRTNASSVPERYKLNLNQVQPHKPNSALDTTKSLVIDENTYKANKQKTSLHSSVYSYIKENKDSLENKFDVLTKDYVNAKGKMANIPLTKYSTLQYFHDELNLQPIIDDKLLKNCVKELNEKGYTNKYENLKAEIPNLSETIESYEILNEFKKISNYPSKLVTDDIKKPVLEIVKNNNKFSLTSNNITENPEKHLKNFLDYDPKDRENNLDL
ncbi:TPA: hypothetical protein O6G22_001221 [Staphylococcus aureus]|nr:hypothetical protein [Staphylococcus aureus]